MAKSDAVAGFLVGFAADCDLRGYPSWVDREMLGKHVATAERILDGARPASDESRAMTEFAESLRESILARNSAVGRERAGPCASRAAHAALTSCLPVDRLQPAELSWCRDLASCAFLGR